MSGDTYDVHTGEKTAGDSRYSDLADCMRANAARFAAHKAHYVRERIDEIMNDGKISQEEKQTQAAAAMNLFHRWGETEEGYATASAQTARKWADFEADGDDYYLQYRTAKDEKVCDERRLLDDTTLPMSDPFWDKYYPPLGWNCRCTVVQVRKSKHKQSVSEDACKAGEVATEKAPSFRFNPGKQRKAFPDGVSYFKHAGENTPKEVMHIARVHNRDKYKTISKIVTYNGTLMIIDDISVREVTKGGATDKSFFYKQEILLQFENYVNRLVPQGSEPIDLGHNNRNGAFARRKRKFTQMNVYELEISGYKYRVKAGVYRNGNLNLYTITDL